MPGFQMEHHVDAWLSPDGYGHSFSGRTLKEYRADVLQFLAHVRDAPVEVISPQDVRAWARSLALPPNPLRPTTISRKIVAVRSFFQYLEETEVIRSNPARAIKGPRIDKVRSVLKRVLSPGMATKMVGKAATPRARALLVLLRYAGLRISEAATLRRDDVRVRDDGCLLLVVTGKRGKTRTVSVNAIASRDLGAWMARVEASSPNNPFLFPGRDGRPISRKTAWLEFKNSIPIEDPEFVRELGGDVEAVSPHWMRHSFATHALAGGASLDLVRKALGHSDLATTGLYLHGSTAETAGDFIR